MESASSTPGSEKKGSKTVKPLSKKKVARFQAQQENCGVLYFSRIPPYLKPDKMRNLLSGLGTEVLRIYLAPEDTAVRSKRLRAGGNKKKNFTEGWVEFDDKRRAKRIASTLNNTAMGGGHRSFYASDLWNVRYLPKFKWHHLTEKIAAEARARQEKMRAELSQAKKETNFYLKKVDQAKAIDAMEERKRKRAQQQSDEGAQGGAAAGAGASDLSGSSAKRTKTAAAKGSAVAGASAGDRSATSEGAMSEVRRRFKQRKVARDGADRVGDDVLGLLGGRGS